MEMTYYTWDLLTETFVMVEPKPPLADTLPPPSLLRDDVPEPPGGWDEDRGEIRLVCGNGAPIKPCPITLTEGIVDHGRELASDMYWLRAVDGTVIRVSGIELTAARDTSIKRFLALVQARWYEAHPEALEPEFTYVNEGAA